uniref:Uncharacterized protein n=1 Tax=Panagrolaimus sp. PS1159 TaxID=55785 RepID=A0AC35F484_9BILA
MAAVVVDNYNCMMVVVDNCNYNYMVEHNYYILCIRYILVDCCMYMVVDIYHNFDNSNYCFDQIAYLANGIFAAQ